MHGAARLVYGQNPEVLPTTTTTASTTTSTTTTTTTTPAPEANSAGSAEDDENDDDDDNESEVNGGNEDEKTPDTAYEQVDNIEMPNESVDEPSNKQPSETGAEVPQIPEVVEEIAITRAIHPIASHETS
ncbi:hypothetical protein EVAR_71493_1 [Eumeta japonica]|uniref:Uncharacterized protein n=1 Tax=Eumeta variegata TaxID=151549 RepID=A0A4C2AFX3_EUMVA|nr:hypothetical protein EVAR_71493_1 [Eumeta japonica]